MKNIIIIVVMVALIAVSSVAYLGNHLVRIEKNYSYDISMIDHLKGTTEVRVETTESMLLSGEIIDHSVYDVTVGLTSAMIAFDNGTTTTKVEFR